MKLEHQVISLELAKRLKALGVPQKGHCLFAHYLNAGQPVDAIVDATMYSEQDADYWDAKLIAAFTVAELGEMLPDLYYSLRHAGDKKWACNLYMGARKDGAEYPNMHGDTEAEARGLMLAYLIENNLMSV